MSKHKKLPDPDNDVGYKTRRMNPQGGSVITSLPKPLLEEVAKELNISFVELVKNFDLAIEVYRDPKGSLLNGDLILSFVERGGKIKK